MDYSTAKYFFVCYRTNQLFQPCTAVTYGSGGAILVLFPRADFNGDGKLDVVVANEQSQTVDVLLNKANGTFAKLLPIAAEAITLLLLPQQTSNMPKLNYFTTASFP